MDFYFIRVVNSVFLLIPLHNTAALINICRFFNQFCFIYANPYEIGPSNTSQGQHRRMDATEQTKNLTRARTRTKVLGISSADALPTKLREPLGRSELLSL